MQPLTAIRHQVILYVQSLRRLRKWVVGDHVPTPYQMVIHSDRLPISEHVRQETIQHTQRYEQHFQVLKMESAVGDTYCCVDTEI